MDGEFVKPNWHIMFMHYPIGLVTVGFFAELLGAIFRLPGLRYSARWMIGIGALLGLPTAILGIYAFRDVVAPGPIDLGMTWSEVVATSTWSQPVYDAVWWHVWLNASASVLLVLVTVIWIASSPAGRKTGYLPLLGMTFIALVAMSSGAWFGGEMVYSHGAGVVSEPSMGIGSVGQPEWVRRYLPPLQVHLLGGGLLAALAVLAMAQSLRYWRVADRAWREAEHVLGPREAETHPRVEPAGAIDPDDAPYTEYPAAGVEPVSAARHGEKASRARALREEDARRARSESAARSFTGPWVESNGHELAPSTGAVRGLWAMTTILGLTVVAGGLWSMLGSLASDELERFWASLGSDPRVLGHFVVGASIVLLPLIPFAMPRLLARSRALAGMIVLLLALLLGAQVYLGSLMLYDGHAGPLIGFNDGFSTSPVSPDPRPGDPSGQSPDLTAAPGREVRVIGMEARAFVPERATLRVGETVEWRNTSDVMHTVTADPRRAASRQSVHLPPGARPFASQQLEPGDVFRHTFEVPGHYRYFCEPHERAGMIAELFVEPEADRPIEAGAPRGQSWGDR